MSNRKSVRESECRLPIRIGPCSNGEMAPLNESSQQAIVRETALDRAERNAKRLGVSRRDFLKSASGAATVLLCMDQVFAGGFFSLPPEAGLDTAAAQTQLSGDEFIFDVQTHHVSPGRDWYKRNHIFDFLEKQPQGQCGEAAWYECYSREQYIKELFLDSDTDMAVLSAVPGVPADNPLTAEEIAATRDIVNRMDDAAQRLFIHGLVLPNAGELKAQLESMDRLAGEWKIRAWKVYTLWGPDGLGWSLDDPEVGIPFLEKARELGIKLICAHKGIPLLGSSDAHAGCRDIGVVAKQYPDLKFLIYHSGFDPRVQEGPFDPKNVKGGVNELVHTLQQNDIAPNSNIYAELGATWRILMGFPEAAAHVVGKLLKHVGEDRVLWGTDSIWFGSPQDQIQAFRAFQIPPEFQEKYGYPALTKEIKEKIFGLNAASVYGIQPSDWKEKVKKDSMHSRRLEYLQDSQPSFQMYGPRNRRELLDLMLRRGNLPA